MASCVASMRRCTAGVFVSALLLAVPAGAATVRGSVADATGGSLGGARVVLRGVATGQASSVETSDLTQGDLSSGDALGADSHHDLGRVLGAPLT